MPTNPTLLRAVRERMAAQSTEQLLDLWVTNDRATWSPEAFEAVKSLLAVRGVRDLPPQNSPAPVADRYSPVADPVARYWLTWLRPVMWVCVGVGVASLPHAIFQLAGLVVATATRRISYHDLWHGRAALYFWLDNVVQSCLLPLLLVVGAMACLRLKRWGRTALLTFATVSVGVGLTLAVLRDMDSRADGWFSVGLLTVPLASEARIVALPGVLWVLLRRHEIRSAFAPFPVGSAFEPLTAERA